MSIISSIKKTISKYTKPKSSSSGKTLGSPFITESEAKRGATGVVVTADSASSAVPIESVGVSGGRTGGGGGGTSRSGTGAGSVVPTKSVTKPFLTAGDIAPQGVKDVQQLSQAQQQYYSQIGYGGAKQGTISYNIPYGASKQRIQFERQKAITLEQQRAAYQKLVNEKKISVGEAEKRYQQAQVNYLTAQYEEAQKRGILKQPYIYGKEIETFKADNRTIPVVKYYYVDEEGKEREATKEEADYYRGMSKSYGVVEEPTGRLEKLYAELKQKRGETFAETFREDNQPITTQAKGFLIGAGTSAVGTGLFVKNLLSEPVETIKSIPSGVKSAVMGSGDLGYLIRTEPGFVTGFLATEYVTIKYVPRAISKAGSKVSKAMGYPKYNTKFYGLIDPSGEVQKTFSVTTRKTLLSEKVFPSVSVSEIKQVGKTTYGTRTAGVFKELKGVTFPTGKIKYGKVTKFASGELSRATLKELNILRYADDLGVKVRQTTTGFEIKGVGISKVAGSAKKPYIAKSYVIPKGDLSLAVGMDVTLDVTSKVKPLKYGKGKSVGIIKKVGDVVEDVSAGRLKTKSVPVQKTSLLDVEKAIEKSIQETSVRTKPFIKSYTENVMKEPLLSVQQKPVTKLSLVSPQKQKTIVKAKPVTKTATATGMRSDLSSGQKLLLRELEQQKVKTSQVLSPVEMQSERQLMKMRSLQRQRQRQEIKYLMKNVFAEPTSPRVPFPRVKGIIPIKPKIKTKPRKSILDEPSFEVFKIVKGKPEVFMKGLSKSTAKDILAKELLSGLAASGGIRKSFDEPIRNIKTMGEYARYKSLFREPTLRSPYRKYGVSMVQRKVKTPSGTGRLATRKERLAIQRARRMSRNVLYEPLIKLRRRKKK